MKTNLIKWPNFFIVGAPKAGTTSLYYYLLEVPQIYLSPVKEPRFFNSKHVHINSQKISEQKKYLELFKDVKKEIAIGEASTSYLEDPETPFLIQKAIPNARIIIILRDPVERAYSHYQMEILAKATNLPFEKIIRMDSNSLKKNPHLQGILQPGFYSESVKRYLEIFGTKQVKILVFEDFIVNTKERVEEIIQFLNIDHQIKNFKSEIHHAPTMDRIPILQNFYENKIVLKIARSLLSPSTRWYLNEKIFSKNVPRSKMLEKDKIFLQNLYREDVQKLRKILDNSLPWVNF